MNRPLQVPRLLTERQAAERLGVTIFCLRKWRTRRAGPPYVKLTDNMASGVRYDATDLEAWIRSRKRWPIGERRDDGNEPDET